jgi:2-desacetyl-2-hydroxyethyl bacteriochlorophyllide A dehydrogenase
LPVPEKGEALIKVLSTGICGSDLTIMSGKHPRAKAPLVLGHEFSGLIENLPVDYSGPLKEGMRVTVEPLLSCGNCKPCGEGNAHVCKSLKLLGVETDGAFAEFVKAPVKKLFPLTEEITDDEGSLFEPLAVAVHAVRLGTLKKGDGVVIFGAGPIGLFCGLVAKAYGAEFIRICEISPERIHRAEELGFEVIDSAKDDIVQRFLDDTDGDGADLVIDAAGDPSVGEKLIPVAAIKGRIVIVALYKKPCEVFLQPLSYRENIIFGSRIYAEGDFAEAIRLVEQKKIDGRHLITKVFGMAEALEAFKAAADSKNNCKVIIRQT